MKWKAMLPHKARTLGRWPGLLVWLLFSALVLTCFLQCEKEGVFDPTPVKPGEYFFIHDLTASSIAVPPGGGTSVVSFTLVDIDRNPVAGKSVKVEANLGSLSSQSVITDIDGRAQVTYTSGPNPGKATIQVSIGESRGSLEIYIGVSKYGLSADKYSIRADEVDSAVITATVVDAAGMPVRGTAVSFATTLGTLSQEVAVTDTLGRASVTLTSSISSSDVIAEVTAHIDTALGARVGKLVSPPSGESNPSGALAKSAQEGAGFLQIVFRGVYIEVGSDTDKLPADGVSTATVTAVLRESASKAAVADRAVTMAADVGTIPQEVSTDQSGKAVATYTSGTLPGPVTLRVSFGTITDTVQVTLTPLQLALEAAPSSVFADGSSTAQITAALKDSITSNPVVGAAILFQSTLGTITKSGVTNEQGRAAVTLTSERANGTAVVTASYKTVVKTIPVAFTGVTLTLAANPQNLLADDRAASTITATLKDAAGAPIVGVPVAMDANLVDAGLELLRVTATTNSQGQITGLVKSPQPGTARVTGSAVGAMDTTLVEFTGYDLTVWALPEVFTASVDSAQILASLRDWDQNPMAGIEVAFSTTLGTIRQVTPTTDGTGTAQAILTSNGAGPATVTVVAMLSDDQKVSQTVEVVVASAEARNVLLTVEPGIVQVKGGMATLNAYATDLNGNPVANTVISFTHSGGRGGASIDPGIATTNANGVATTVFTSGTIASSQIGDVQIQASVHGTTVWSNVVTLTIAGAPATLTIGFSPPPDAVGDGTFELPVAALVSDINGNPVADGTRVDFSVDRNVGVIGSPVTTAGGKARTKFIYPVTEAGERITIHAQAGAVSISETFVIPGFTGTVASLELSLESDANVLGNGEEEVALVVLVTDTEQHPAGDLLVTFVAAEETTGVKTGPQYLVGSTQVANPDWGVARTTVSRVTTEDLDVPVQAFYGDKASNVVHLTFRGVSLSVEAAKTSIGVEGETFLISVLLKEATSHAPIVGAELRFGTSLGTIVATSVTDERGMAANTLRSGSLSGTAVVTVNYNGIVASTSVAIEEVVAAPVSIVLVSADPQAIGVRGSGDNETAQLLFRVKDAYGRDVPDGTSISFVLVSDDTTARISPEAAETVGGLVSTTVTSGVRSGAVLVRATATDYPEASSGAISVAVHGGPPVKEHFSLAVEKFNIEGLLKSGLSNRITAFVFDQYGNPVPEGTAVWFRIMDELCGNVGGIDGSAHTNASGQASVNLWSAGPDLPPGGRVYLEAQTIGRGDISITDTTWVLFSGPTAPISIFPSFINPDLDDQTFDYYVRDINGNPLVAGSQIELTADGGTVSGDIDVTVQDSRVPGFGYTEFVCRFKRKADAEAGSAQITVSVTSPNGDRTETITQQRRTMAVASSVGMALLDSSFVTDGLMADGLTEMEVIAYVYDDSARGLGDKTVAFYNSVNTNVVTALTDGEGKAAMTFSTAASGWNAVDITAVADLVQSTITVPLRTVQLTLTAEQATLTANGNTRTPLYAALTSEMGGVVRPEPNKQLHFQTTLGELSATSRVTDGNGEVTGLSLGSGTVPGAAEITAAYGLISAVTTVQLAAPAPAQIAIATEVDAILANGVDSAPFTAVVKDQEGERLPNATVRFYSADYPDARFFPQETWTDKEGVATTTLTGWASTSDVNMMVTASVDSSQTVAKRDSVGITLEGITLTLTADRPSIVGNGYDEVTLVAELQSTRRAVTEGEIRFRTDLGTLSSPGATTDQYGFASVSLRSVADGAANINATYITGVVEDGVTVTVTPAVPNDLKLEISPSVMIADNMSRADLSVVLSNNVGNYTVDDQVDFTSTFALTHPASGDSSRRPQLLNSTVHTVNGQGTVQVLSGYAIGTLAISASAVGGTLVSTPDTIRITFKPGAPIIDYIDIAPTAIQQQKGLDRATIEANGLDRAVLSVHVQRPGPFDLKGALVTLDASIGQAASPVTTDDSGLASTYFTCTQTGLARITVTVANEAGAAEGLSDFIQVVPGAPATIELSVADDFVGVRGVGRKASTIVTAVVSDVYGNTVADSTLVRFEIVDSPSYLDYSAVYQDALTSPEADSLMLGADNRVPTVGGAAQVAFVSGSRAGTVRIRGSVIDKETGALLLEGRTTEFQIISGPPYLEQDRSATPGEKMYRGHIAIDSPKKNLYAFGDTTTITAFVGDRYNNPVAEGTSVYFTSTGGIIEPLGAGRTNALGMVQAVLIKTAPFASRSWDGIDRYLNVQNVYLTNVVDPNLPAAGGQNTIPPTPVLARDLESGSSPFPNATYRVQNSFGGYTENDGFVRVMASTRGVDASGDSAIVWAVEDAIFSEAVSVFGVAQVTWTDTVWNATQHPAFPDTVYYHWQSFTKRFDADGDEDVTSGGFGRAIQLFGGRSASIMIRCYDQNGNPVVPGSVIAASADKGDTGGFEVTTDYPYGGPTVYYFSFSNNLTPEDALVVGTTLDVSLDSGNGHATDQLGVTLVNAPSPDLIIGGIISIFNPGP